MLKATRTCVCGTIMESNRIDCGTATCVARTNQLDAERADRTQRFEDLRDVAGYNTQTAVERAASLQMATFMTRRRIARQLQHEVLVRALRQERFEEMPIDDEG